MKDSNERPLPSDAPVEDTLTISEFLHSVHHPQEDMTRATIRFGQYAFNQYRKQYGRPPYTRRINGNGPVKVYLDPIEYIFLSHTYEQWRRTPRPGRQRRIEPARRNRIPHNRITDNTTGG